jgi:hypothetical protein
MLFVRSTMTSDDSSSDEHDIIIYRTRGFGVKNGKNARDTEPQTTTKRMRGGWRFSLIAFKHTRTRPTTMSAA